jgi:N-hydroxyarylamine O-acetyltransferase
MTPDLHAYLRRIGHEGEPRPRPTLDTLKWLIQRHMASIPFEAIDVLLGRPIRLDAAALDAKLVHGGRGGYCMEQNSLLLGILGSLGFEAQFHLARVWNGAAPEGPAPPPTHMALQVIIDGKPWLADVGFGGFLSNEPLRLDTEEPQQMLYGTYRVIRVDGGKRLEMLIDARWSALYLLMDGRWHRCDIEMANWYTSTHPDSPFRNTLVAALTLPERRYGLRGNQLTIRRPGGEVEKHALDADRIKRALAERLGLPVTQEWQPIIDRAAAEDGTTQ